jgi:hypothetical protein
MTDSSSNDDAADLAAELITAKMESARKETQMTHVLRIGSFHMEIVPELDIDVEKMFGDTLDKLIDKFGEKLLEISIQQITESKMNHYG